MTTTRCDICGFPAELVYKNHQVKRFVCSTCGKPKTVKIGEKVEEKPDLDENERKSAD